MNWFCVHTRPRQEQSVAQYLRERFGLETYTPKLRKKKAIRRVMRTVTSPLFPRYLFSRFDLAARYRAVRYAPEVIDVVGFGGNPVVVDEALIAELRSWAGEAVDLIDLQPPLQTGDRVQITDGPMRGLPAVVLHIEDDRDRVAVLLSILECGARMIVNRSQLAPASLTG